MIKSFALEHLRPGMIVGRDVRDTQSNILARTGEKNFFTVVSSVIHSRPPYYLLKKLCASLTLSIASFA